MVEKLNCDWSEIEIYKLEFEYLKYITTICTGSILLVITFLDKLFEKPELKTAIAISLCSFLVSIIICAFTMASIIEKASEKNDLSWRNKVQKFTIGLIFTALGAYLVGVVSLVWFGLKNLF